MIKLRDKDIEKLSAITKLPSSSLALLSSMGLLDSANTTNLLILHDWKTLKKTKKYTVKQIIQALMEEYGASRSKVQSAIYLKKQKMYYCGTCGKRISKGEHLRNEGICDLCVSKTIQL